MACTRFCKAKKRNPRNGLRFTFKSFTLLREDLEGGLDPSLSLRISDSQDFAMQNLLAAYFTSS